MSNISDFVVGIVFGDGLAPLRTRHFEGHYHFRGIWCDLSYANIDSFPFNSETLNVQIYTTIFPLILLDPWEQGRNTQLIGYTLR